MITGTLLCVLFVPLFYVMIMRVSGSANERNVDLKAAAAETAYEAKALKSGELTFYDRDDDSEKKENGAPAESDAQMQEKQHTDKKGE